MNGKTKTFGIIAIICAALAVTFLTNIPTWLKYKNNEITDLNSETLVLTKGDIIEGDADYVLGAAAEEKQAAAYTEHSGNSPACRDRARDLALSAGQRSSSISFT